MKNIKLEKGKYLMNFNLKMLNKKLKIQTNKKIKIPTFHFCIVNYRHKSLYLQSTHKITTQNKINKSYTYLLQLNKVNDVQNVRKKFAEFLQPTK